MFLKVDKRLGLLVRNFVIGAWGSLASPPVRRAAHPPLHQKPSYARQLAEREKYIYKIRHKSKLGNLAARLFILYRLLCIA